VLVGRDGNEAGGERAEQNCFFRFFFFFFFFLVFFFLQARKAAKSGLVLYHEAMERFDSGKLEESLELFEKAAAKGHSESIWILSVVKDVEKKRSALKEAFGKTEEPLGWYFAGELSDWDSYEEFDFYKKSAEGGCSWGQTGYGRCFYISEILEDGDKIYVEWLEKAVAQNNPWAMDLLGDWFREEIYDMEKAVSCYRAAAEVGWRGTLNTLATMLKSGEGCAKDLREAVILSAKEVEFADVFWKTLEQALEKIVTRDLDCNFNQLCFSLGWGLYWYVYGSESWQRSSVEIRAFADRCLDYYCEAIELQQKSIFAFLLLWNRRSGGVKDVGVMIGKMVWETRENNLVMVFGK
jgi:tetratricopeptide (TPR) repeat protein